MSQNDISYAIIKKVQRKIDVIKMNEEIGVKYMNAWEEKVLDRQEAYNEGIAEGESTGIIKGKTEGAMTNLIMLIQRKQKKGQSADQIAEDLLENPGLVNKICSLIAEHPAWDAERIYKEYKENGEI